MKRYLFIMILLLEVFIGRSVFAMQHITREIIPVGEVATVETEMFSFTNFTYTPTVEGKEYGKFNFESVTNKTSQKIPVSINLLLFNSEKKNIAFLTYCTSIDVGGDYAQFKLKANQTSPFSINVSDRYFVEGFGPKDVSYFAVLDENPYCQDGGYEKYAGLTMEEITSGKVVVEKEGEDGEEAEVVDSNNPSLDIDLQAMFKMLALLVAVYVIQGIVLNALYKRMLAMTSPLSYLPIGSNYVAVRLAFGEKVGKIFLVAFFVSFVFTFLGLSFISYIFVFASSIAFCVDIYKLISKKYDFCYLEPYVSNANVALSTGGFHLKNEEDNTNTEEKKEEVVYRKSGDGFIKTESESTFITGTTGQEVIDLNYSNSTPNDGFIETDTSSGDSFSFDSTDFNNISSNSNTSSSTNINTNTDNSTSSVPTSPPNQKDGESDLANLFK